MVRKILFVLLALAGWSAQAQLGVGEWYIHKPSSSISRYDNQMWNDPFVGYKMVETPEKVYYVSQGTLVSFDKSTDELYTYSSVNKLSDNYINGVWYNKAGKYLFIAYKNGNIDVLYDDGKVHNLPDIKDVQLTSNKTIYDVAFDGDRAYVGTSFGIVAFNVPGRYVIESGIYNVNVTSVAVMDGKLLAHTSYKPYELRFIDPSKQRLNKWDNFSLMNVEVYGNMIRPLGNNRLLARGSRGDKYVPYIYTVNFSNNSLNKRLLVEDPIDYFLPTDDGKYMAQTSDGSKIYTFNTDGTYTVNNLSAKIHDDLVIFAESPKTAWVGGNGLAQMDVTVNPVTVKRDYMHPNLPSVSRALFMDFTPSGRLLLGNMGVSSVYNETLFGLTVNDKGYINILSDGDFVDITPKLNYTYQGMSADKGNLDTYYDIMGLVEDPENPDVYYATNFWSGLDKFARDSKGEWSTVWHADYSCIPEGTAGLWGAGIGRLAFDRNNNLWMLPVETKNTTRPKIMMLPAAARNKSKITASDWKVLNISQFNATFDPQILVCQHSDMIFFNDGYEPATLIAYDTKGTASLNDDTYHIWTRFVDQDGKTFDMKTIYSMAEDKEGRVWLGTQSGILEITNPSDATNSSMTFNRLKVPRNDGSGLADYLLDAQVVTDIAVNGANQKWIGTNSSGVYNVSADGDEVLQHFTSDNSELVDNMVYRVACDPASSSVYIANPYALVEYGSETAPVAEDFSDIMAFPNPVRPDYAGPISIKGLMDGTRIKIADSAGNVFLDKRAEGGMVTWDGCNSDGSRVTSGVYYVFASRSGDGMGNKGAVTKIVVIR